MPVPGHESYFIGKDGEACACLLVAKADRAAKLQPPIRLETLDVQFDLRCHLRKNREPEREGHFYRHPLPLTRQGDDQVFPVNLRDYLADGRRLAIRS
jgi:hypothetical protein